MARSLSTAISAFHLSLLALTMISCYMCPPSPVSEAVKRTSTQVAFNMSAAVFPDGACSSDRRLEFVNNRPIPCIANRQRLAPTVFRARSATDTSFAPSVYAHSPAPLASRASASSPAHTIDLPRCSATENRLEEALALVHGWW
ncbi:hypothetical protein FA95DRAFT_1563767 [Auriscalpium vulgare]|uniref:Uncharacterized protein n=1 Tax=Auriscalpium vulgare TaxID=40419 RepID=A0ACB8RGE2_9AGAM|nr:hypothetical protein FA95DRAFT_1563767 [Auriscalpium vulgare]